MIEFKLPDLGENVESAHVAEMHVAEGDTIEAGQIVMEVETEKAVAEVPCPHAGRVKQLHVAAGDSVTMGQKILTLEETAPVPGKPQTAPVDGKKNAAAGRSTADGNPDDTRRAARSASPSPDRETPSPTAFPSNTTGRPGPGSVPAGPATRRLARQLGIDLLRISGSGRGGRITQEDVARAHAAARGPAAAPPPLPDFSRFGPVERQPLSKIARTSAANLSLAWQTIPHVTQHDVADVTELEAARRRYMNGIGKNGPKVTITAIAVKAAVALLKEFPHFNASLDSETDELVLKRYYHVGVAVDTPNGLLVPVVRDADRLTTRDIAARLTDLAEKARNRKLSLDDMQGATFTITNLGGIGGTAFTPIVNYPEVAILGLSRTRKQVEVLDGATAVRLMLPLSLSYDHRVINGADAARFVVKLSAMLSDAFHLLAEC